MRDIEAIARKIIDDDFGGDESLYQTCVKCVLHDSIFQALNKSGMLKHVVFHGGTCAQKVYGGSRLSEDIDFNFAGGDVKKFFETGKKFSEIVRRTLIEKHGFSDAAIEIDSPKSAHMSQKSTSKWLIKVIVGAKSASYAPKSKIKVEISSTPAVRPVKSLVRPFKEVLGFSPIIASVSSLEEMFVDKATALIGRTYLKYRDVYDIQFFRDKHVKFDNALFLSKLKSHLPTIQDYLKTIESRKQALQSDQAIDDFGKEMSRFIGARKVKEWKDEEYTEEVLKTSVRMIDSLTPLLLKLQEEENKARERQSSKEPEERQKATKPPHG